ncbi:MAG: hypothetical protein AB9872_15650 [Solidesulfovibrio sp.]
MAEDAVTTQHPFFTYTAEILSWRLGEPLQTAVWECPTPVQTTARAKRILRAGVGRQGVVLLGLGTGELAAALAKDLPPAMPLTVLSLTPAAVRSLHDADALAWRTPDGPRQLLADTSEQALFCLLAMAEQTAATALVTVNPEAVGPDERQGLARLRRLLTESAPARTPAPAPDTPASSLTLAVMARPNEPDLAAFFAAANGLANQAVILWDGDTVPDAANLAARLGIPVKHLARRLDRDFAAQRDAMLAACPQGWILYLDPDERPGPGFRESLDRIMATDGVGSAFFPRQTLFPDESRVKAGYGLWPDLQLRLFQNTPPARPRFVRPIHERLEGLSGRAALALDAPILHYNRLLADDASVVRKLAAFSAAPGAPRHHLSHDYPTLPREFFAALAGTPPLARVLLLPALW